MDFMKTCGQICRKSL